MGEFGANQPEVLTGASTLGSAQFLDGPGSLAFGCTRANQTQSAAEQLARALLLENETPDPAALKDQSGETQDALARRVQITDYGSAQDHSARKNDAKAIYRVSWEDHGRACSLSLRSLRLVEGDCLAGTP